MDSLVNTMKGAALSVGQMLTPVLKESKFRETGVLTPDEFVAAGDHLVHHCPTWSWARAIDASKTKNFLPEAKQFLITRNVPCYRRCVEMDYDPRQEKVLTNEDVGVAEGYDGGDDDGGWVDTHHFAPDGGIQEAANMEESSSEKNDLAPSEEDDDGPSMDMDSFIDGGGLEDDDPNRFVAARVKKIFGGAQGDTIIHTRTYDLHITYDKYYQVPRLWLSGYDESRKPLTVEQMNEDFSQDHANKTITMETHPHLHNTHMASIHPCRHAEVMKRLIEQLAESGRELTVEQYLLVFLKFVQAVIPTVEYDYTRSIRV